MNRRQLAADHVWLPRHHAKRLAGTLDYWDLLSVGNEALVNAAKSWPGKLDFIPYATSKIVWKMRDAIRDSQRNIRTAQETNRIGLAYCDDHQYESSTSASGNHRVAFDPHDENENPAYESVCYIIDWLDQLPADEQRAIRLAYGIGTRKRTTVEIAKRLKLPQHVASEVIRSGLLRLRYMATCEQRDGYEGGWDEVLKVRRDRKSRIP